MHYRRLGSRALLLFAGVGLMLVRLWLLVTRRASKAEDR
jgi:hypothetical protein